MALTAGRQVPERSWQLGGRCQACATTLPTWVSQQYPECLVHVVVAKCLLCKPHHHCRQGWWRVGLGARWRGERAKLGSHSCPPTAAQLGAHGGPGHPPLLELSVGRPSQSGSAFGCSSRKGRRRRSSSRRRVAVSEENTWRKLKQGAQQAARAGVGRSRRWWSRPGRGSRRQPRVPPRHAEGASAAMQRGRPAAGAHLLALDGKAQPLHQRQQVGYGILGGVGDKAARHARLAQPLQRRLGAGHGLGAHVQRACNGGPALLP